ncbi:MAG: hypothetical protein NC084_06380 [Bacteroides sp.]|nr:hypothetical protein [Eubacterium sp.]MCM1418149.1 hypothetical protein [Roseburia sp.]MCM1462326.1 hypothetical protein [Bacteroides sp.]
MDWYFYQVEKGDHGEKLVHFSGNLYDCDSGEPGENLTLDEWTGVYFTIPDLIELARNGTLADRLCAEVAYSGHLDEASGHKLAGAYFGDNRCKELPVLAISEETPCGCYRCDGLPSVLSEPTDFAVTLTVTVSLSTEEIDDIMSTALDYISYWCYKAEVVGEYLGEYASDQIARGGSLILHDAESNEKWELTLGKLLNGVRLWISDNEDGILCLSGGRIDTMQIDGRAADCIVQLALFGKKVFA